MSASQQQQKYPLEVSFSKFHVTRPNRAGYNKIYEIRRSKSFLFELADPFASTNENKLIIHTNDYHMKTKAISYSSTSPTPNKKYQISIMLRHFFSHQSVIPKRIQHKYFPLIRKKLLERITFIKSRVSQDRERNHSTNTFFNFSYKRYRFYFGIYIPCNHIIDDTKNSGTLKACKIPSPMVLSFNRCACVSHQRYLQRFDHLKPRSKATTASILSPFQIHSNLIHQRWKSKEIKTIYSNRLGITYTSRYVNNKHKSNDSDGSDYMYYKRLENFNRTKSTSTRTQRRQNSRFDRACRRIFNKDKKLKSDTKYRQRLRATKFNFLLDRKQFCQKRVQHQKHVWRNGFNIFKPYHHPPAPLSNGYIDEPIVYSSGQLRSRLDSIITKKRPPEPIYIPATIMLARKRYLSDYDNFRYYIRSQHIISDTAISSPSTTPPTTPPPGARSIPILDFPDEDVGPSTVTKRESQILLSNVKRTKTNPSLSLPQKRTSINFSTVNLTTDTKKTKF